MCGIFGVKSLNIDRNKFNISLNLLSHRGPDSSKTYFYNDVALGFRRLSILDLSNYGDQPMHSSCGLFSIVFNGEIYNYKEIKHKLENEKQIVFVSNSDTEVLLNALIIYGIKKTLEIIEGMFAFAFFSVESNVITIARDRFGQKPLFYFLKGGEFCFSSEIKSILSYFGVQKTGGINTLGCYNPIFTTGLSPGGSTCFANIQKVKQGHYLQFDISNSEIKDFEYFHPSDLVSEDVYRGYSNCSFNEILDEYCDNFDASVKMHLRSDAEIACLFSAGVDSSLVAAIASKYSKISLYHYESEQDNYQRYVDDFSTKFNMPVKVLKGGDSNYIKQLPKLLWHYETVNKIEGLALGGVTKIAREDGVKALITGDAADEIFAGYPTSLDFYNRNIAFNSSGVQFLKKVLNKAMPKYFSRYSEENPLNLYNTTPFQNSLNEGPLNIIYHQGRRLQEWQRSYNAYSFLENGSNKAINAFLLDEISYRLERYLIRSDGFGMMNSMEIRSPFLYTPIVKMALNTPIEYKIKKNLFIKKYEQKHIVKEVAKRYGVPKTISNRKKIGTPISIDASIVYLLKKWPLDNITELLHIDRGTLINVLLNSYDPELFRLRFSILSMDMIIDMFINGVPYEYLSERISKELGQ